MWKTPVVKIVDVSPFCVGDNDNGQVACDHIKCC